MFAAFKRDMYAGNRPNWLAQVLNRGWAWVAASGIAPNYLVTLEVIGRKSGKLIAFPVVVALLNGQRYLVSMLGNDAQWVLNVRAANGKAYVRSGHRREVRLEEVPIEQRAPILKAYLQRAPGARPHMAVHKDAPLADFEAVAATYPVFRIKPYSA
jgi:deazaflavin-dependent oxidoreductase (nitroreductase family)